MPVDFLKAMPEHWAIDLSEDVLADLDDEVRSDSKDVPIER